MRFILAKRNVGIHDRNEKTEGFARSGPRRDNETLSRPRFGEGLPLVPVEWKPFRSEREDLGRFRANVTGVDELVCGWPHLVSRIQGKKSVWPKTAFFILLFNRLTQVGVPPRLLELIMGDAFGNSF